MLKREGLLCKMTNGSQQFVWWRPLRHREHKIVYQLRRLSPWPTAIESPTFALLQGKPPSFKQRFLRSLRLKALPVICLKFEPTMPVDVTQVPPNSADTSPTAGHLDHHLGH